MPSLIGRLLWRLALVAFVLVVLLSLVLVRQFVNTSDSLRDRNLSGQAKDIARYLSATPDGQLQLDLPEQLRRAYAANSDTYIYRIVDGNGRVVLSSDAAETALYQQQNTKIGLPEFFRSDRIVGEQPQTFFGASLPVQRNDQAFTVQVAQGPAHGDVLVDEFLEELWLSAGWVVLAAFMIVVAVIYLTVRGTLAPVMAASRQAERIGPRAMDSRIDVAGLPREIMPLVGAINGALERIERGYRLQEQFTANAAHEIRTPIAVLRAHLDVLEDRGLAAELGVDVARLDRLVRQLMRLAQADDLHIDDSRRADLNKVAIDAAVLLGPAAITNQKSIAVVQADHAVQIHGHPDFLAFALRNLIENALKATPKDSTVEVEVEADGSVCVSDAGPGVPEDRRDLIFERFWRGRAGGDTGAGLGLSIVRQIVEAHHGTITVTDGPRGGARFSLQFVLING